MGREKCLRNRLDKRHFRGLAWPQDAKPAPPGAAGSTVAKTGLNLAGGGRLVYRAELEPESKKEIPAKLEFDDGS